MVGTARLGRAWRSRERPQGLPTPYSSDTVYLSASGSQATLPIHTPWATSLSRRPRFLPRMVSKVPPSKGPLRGSICQVTRERGKWGPEAGMLEASSPLSHAPRGRPGPTDPSLRGEHWGYHHLGSHWGCQ